MTISEATFEPTPNSFWKRKNIVAFALFFLLVISGFFLYSKLFSPSDEVTCKSIMVLPFVNMSHDPNQEYFSDGVSDELIQLLAKFPELKLTGRSTSFALKEKKEDAKTIGEKFGIEYLLQGSIQWDSAAFTIEARLMNALDGSQLWGKTYRSDEQDIFKVQDDITRDVVSELNLKLFPASAKSTKMNQEAFHLMLEGNFENRKGTTVSGFRSIQLFHRALVLEPESSKIWGDLASAYALRARLALSNSETDSLTLLARDAAQKSIELDPSRPEGHNTLANIALSYDWDAAKAKAETDKALTLDPANVEALYMVAEIQRTLGKVEDAITTIRKVLAIDPLNANLHVALSNRLLYQGKIDEAFISMNKAFELNPNRIAIHYLLARLYVLKGDPVMAFDELQKESDANWHMYGLPTVLFEKKLYKASEAALVNLIEKRANERSLRIAEIYAWREDNDKAFEWLEHARINHDQSLYQSLKNNVWLKKIENNPRFAKFLKKMNLPAQK